MNRFLLKGLASVLTMAVMFGTVCVVMTMINLMAP